ncbi:MAG: phenylalanine--tRNA ligase beta subunit-related protein [Pseudomonadota bacterium]
MLIITDEWKKLYPDAHVGILIMNGVSNPAFHPDLDREKKQLEVDLRTLFRDEGQLKSEETVKAYQAYYKRFKKTYHVMQQVQSVCFKGRPIPTVAALVEAMFMAELRNMLLTAGHDLESAEPPLRLDASKGDETYVRINGTEQILKAGDMFIADGKGIISSVIYGPDRRTQISASTRKVCFSVYAVPGVGERAALQHLKGIEEYVRLFSPNADIEEMTVYGAGQV